MKKVLFIDYFFPPMAADWRGVAFAKFLPQFGWQPVVVSAADSVNYDKDYSLLQEIPSETKVCRVGHFEPPKSWLYARRRLKLEADFPDYYKSWQRPAYLAAREILRQEKVDLIYSASPTFTTAFVAMQLKQEFGIPWVADFLDGWSVNDFLNVQFDQYLLQPLRRWHKNRIRRAEHSILETADKVTVIHPHIKQRWVELHKIEESKVVVITDGYDESAFAGLSPRFQDSDRLTIVFLGSFYESFREPIRNFLAALHEVDENADAVFIGRAATYIQKMNAPNSTCILHLPQKKAFTFALSSHFLFEVMPEYAKWSPTKTYDYLRLGKPILALVPRDGDTAKIIRQAKAGFVLPFDQACMKQQLRMIFDEWRRGELKDFRPDTQYITQFERQNITERMVQVFNEVAL